MSRRITEMTDREFSRLHEAHEDRELDSYLRDSEPEQDEEDEREECEP